MKYMGSLQKKIVSVMILLTIVIGCCYGLKPESVSAATKYVTRGEIIQMILDELHEPYDELSETDYIVTAQRVGLIGEKTFTDFDAYAKKAEVAMLLVRADEYLYGKTANSDLVKKIMKCRISDITKVRKGYRTFLAKSFALGYIKGNSNGVYSTNRKFNPSYKVNVAYAENLVSLIRDKESRHKISPDGQLIRTTNLPKLASFYPYILDSFPNSYYDWKFLFMRTMIGDDLVYGTDRWVNLVDYASPKDFTNFRKGKKVFYCYYDSRNSKSAEELYNECIDEWEVNARNYLECVFNVDYRTVKDDIAWKDKLSSADLNSTADKKNSLERIDKWIDKAVKNKTIVKSKYIAVDRSSLYYSNGFMYLRAYVRYNVVSSKDISCVPNSPIIFTREIYPELINLKVGEWRDGYFNIMVSSYVPNYGVDCLLLNDYFYENGVIDV